MEQECCVGHLPMVEKSEVDRAGQRGGDGDGDDEEGKYNLLHEGFPKLGAPHTVVLVCFA